MSFVRLFVGNVPSGTTEDELSNEFAFYGKVKKVELKTKNDSEFFAFVNIEIDEKLIEKCIREFSQQKFHGNFLNISRAKESFLDRLKREREESTQVDQGDSSYNHNSYNKNDYQQETYKPLPTIEKEILSGGESSEDEDDQGEATEVSARQLQVIKAAKTFRLDDDGKTVLTKAELDDKKRQESLKKLKDRHMEQKIAIRNALSASAGPRNNKIVFEPPEPMEVEQEPASKAQLFDEEDDEVDTGNFTVKKQFAGKNGARMLELQSQFGDNRFKIDERFVDDSDGLIDARKKYTREELKERKKLRKEMLNWDQDEMKEERDHQLSILESITGQSTGFVKSQHKPNLDHKEMLRFDPSKKDHKKYLDIVRGDEDVDDDEDPKDKKTDENFQVSSERFYEVSDNLASALQTSSKPFSIFEMLGVSHNDPDEVAVDKNPAKEEEIEPKLLSKLPMFQLNQMKFQYDSSDTDEEEEKRKQMNQKKKVHKDKQNQSKGGKYSKSGVFRFNLFYTDDDPRLKEGLNFLKVTTADASTRESFEKTRKNLKQVIKTRVRKARQDQRKNERNFKKRKVSKV